MTALFHGDFHDAVLRKFGRILSATELSKPWTWLYSVDRQCTGVVIERDDGTLLRLNAAELYR